MGSRVPQVSLVLRDLKVATPAASIMCIALFLPHFGSPVVHGVLAQVSQLRRDLGHPAELKSSIRWYLEQNEATADKVCRRDRSSN